MARCPLQLSLHRQEYLGARQQRGRTGEIDEANLPSTNLVSQEKPAAQLLRTFAISLLKRSSSCVVNWILARNYLAQCSFCNQVAWLRTVFMDSL